MADLTVADRGAGIPAGEEARIFEPFFRPRGRSESAGGWGLGLALCRQIAERHGGSISAANRTGGGAEFIVRLPLVV